MGRCIFLACLTLSCSGGTPGSDGCNDNAQCQAGQVCDADACLTLCVTDRECGADSICNGTTCEAGSRGDAPVIGSVDGDSSEVCPDAMGTHCVESALLVTGQFLLGATFELITASESFTLDVVPGGTNTFQQLVMPDAPPGEAILNATNSAGSGDQTVTLLQGPTGAQGPRGDQGDAGIQGPPGADGPPGSPDTGTDILTKLAPFDGASSGLDADQLDGVEASAFVVDTGDTISGMLQITAGDSEGPTDTNLPLRITSGTQNLTIDGNEIDSDDDLYLQNNTNNMVRVQGMLKVMTDNTSYGSGANSTPEVYRLTSGPTCTRGAMFVGRASGAGDQDSLCVCLRLGGADQWWCFNP